MQGREGAHDEATDVGGAQYGGGGCKSEGTGRGGCCADSGLCIEVDGGYGAGLNGENIGNRYILWKAEGVGEIPGALVAAGDGEISIGLVEGDTGEAI